MGLATGGACSGLESFLHPRAAERVVWNVKVLRIRYTVRPAAVPADACHGSPRARHAAPLHSCHAWGALRLLLAWVAM